MPELFPHCSLKMKHFAGTLFAKASEENNNFLKMTKIFKMGMVRNLMRVPYNVMTGNLVSATQHFKIITRIITENIIAGYIIDRKNTDNFRSFI